MTNITAQRANAAMHMALAIATAQRTAPTRTTTFEAFQRRYYFDPSGFMLNCVNWPLSQQPTPYQLEAGTLLLKHKRFSARGPHGLGKTATIALLILWFALTRDGSDWKIPTTASAWRQLTKYLWPEIHKWAMRLNWQLIGRPPFNDRTELTSMSLTLSTGEAFAAASNRSALIEGAHADHMLYVFDEAKEIPGATFDAAEGALASDGETYAIAFSTPGPPQGRFYEIHSQQPGYEDWYIRHVTITEAIDSGRVNTEWVANRARQWGATSAVYKNKVEGEFATSEADNVIPLEWVQLAINRGRNLPTPETLTRMGVDVARTGENKTAFALRSGNRIFELRKYHREDTMEIVGRVRGVVDKYTRPEPHAQVPAISVDVMGLGAGVYDRLREQGYKVIPFNASSYSDAIDISGELGFLNRRSAAWWHLRELLHPDYHHNIILPDDRDLVTELTTPLWRVVSDGKIKIESKEDIARRLDGRSTDTADAVVMAFDDDEPYIETLGNDITTALTGHRGV